MKIPSNLKQAQRFLDKNSPVILTGMALVGLAGTVYLTAKGSFKAAEAIGEAEVEKFRKPDGEIDFSQPHTLSTQEKFLATYKFYIPAAATTIGTGTCMVLATKIGLNRTAALGAALVVAERGSEQYRDKVKELLGDSKATKVNDAIAQDVIDKVPASHLAIPRDGEQLFYDGWSGRSFPSTMERVKKAVNELNHEMLYGDYASLTQFYDFIGLEGTTESDNIGWNNQRLLELTFTTVLKDDKAVVYFEFAPRPKHTFQSGNI